MNSRGKGCHQGLCALREGTQRSPETPRKGSLTEVQLLNADRTSILFPSSVKLFFASAAECCGEAGSLLKIGDDIVSAIGEAKKLAREEPALKQDDSLAAPAPVPRLAEIPLDLTCLTDEEFRNRAEHELLDLLGVRDGGA